MPDSNPNGGFIWIKKMTDSQHSKLLIYKNEKWRTLIQKVGLTRIKNGEIKPKTSDLCGYKIAVSNPKGRIYG